jgi:S-adenosylmethionine decarboxylase proenzyme
MLCYGHEIKSGDGNKKIIFINNLNDSYNYNIQNIRNMFVGYLLCLYLLVISPVSIAYDTKGTHVIIDAWNVTIPHYNKFNEFILYSAVKSNITILNSTHHLFNALDHTSYTALYLLSESHISIHTYPEKKYASLDIYTCGTVDTYAYSNKILDFLYGTNISKDKYVKRTIKRGHINDIGPVNVYKLTSSEYNSDMINVLYKIHSPFQYINIFRDNYYGLTLMIDNLIQYTELNGPKYTKAMVKQISDSNKYNKKILIIGGGDGFILDHLLENKYKYSIHSIKQVDIDFEVLKATTLFFKFESTLCFDEIVTCLFKDGAEYLKNNTEQYDFIIIDSTDPFEPLATVLFTTEFYNNIYKALYHGGKMIQQMSIDQYEYMNQPYYKLMSDIFNTFHVTYSPDTYEFGGRTIFSNVIKL